MKSSPGISNFLEEISSLSHSIVFLYFFALIAEEGFLFLLAILWNSALRWIYLSFSLFPFASPLFLAICKASSDNHFSFLHFFFLVMVLIAASCTVSQTSAHNSSGALSDLIPWIYFSLPLYNHKAFDLGYACSWGRKESDMTERLNWTELNWVCICNSKFLIYPSLSAFYPW